MRNVVALMSVVLSLPLIAGASGLDQGLDVIKKDVQKELAWLNQVNSGKLAAFLAKHSPAVSLMIETLAKDLAKAKDAEKGKIRAEIADVLETPLYLYRDYERYREKDPAKAALCLKVILLEDTSAMLVVDIDRLKKKKAKPAAIQAKNKELQGVEKALEKLYDRLDAK